VVKYEKTLKVSMELKVKKTVSFYLEKVDGWVILVCDGESIVEISPEGSVDVNKYDIFDC